MRFRTAGGGKALIISILSIFYFFNTGFSQSADFTMKDQTDWEYNNGVRSPRGTSNVTLFFQADPSLGGNDWTHSWHFHLEGSPACPDQDTDQYTADRPNCTLHFCHDCQYSLIIVTHTICSTTDPNNCITETRIINY
jgi:hypothetical protein